MFYRILVAIFILSGSCVVGSAQRISRCRTTTGPETPKYRLGKVKRMALDAETVLVLQISVASEQFNKEDMTALAGRLTKEFCHEKRLSVAITDRYDAAKSGDLIPDLLRGTPNPALRGAFNLDRETGKSSASFSTQRGRPLDEVHLDLGN